MPLDRTVPADSPALDDAIAALPLATPDMLLLDVIGLMLEFPEGSERGSALGGCAIAIAESKRVGMFTERDVVRWSAKGLDFQRTTLAQVMGAPVETVRRSQLGDLFGVLALMRDRAIQYLPVVEDDDTVLGAIALETIRQILQPCYLFNVRSVAQAIAETPSTAPPNASILELTRVMADRPTECVVICDRLEQLDRPARPLPVGIVTERDILRLQHLQWDLRSTRADRVMSAPLIGIRPEESLWCAHERMQQHRIRHVTVTGDRGELLGVLTQSQLLQGFDPQTIYETMQQLGEQLEGERSERRRLEAELHKIAIQEQELGELKSRFTSMVTHEFRNPLTTILYSTQLLETFGHRATEEKKRSYLLRIRRTAQYMNQLIEDLLVIGGSDEAKLEFNPKPLALDEVCQDLIEQQHLSDGGRNPISFEIEGDRDEVCMDEKLLRYIFTNLLANACKYSPKGMLVEFHVACEDERAIFYLSDRGIGIPPEECDRLFDPFYRATNVGNIPGTGLGLSMVKRCVESHYGTIAVESEVGVGTRFIVTLPLGPISEVDRQTPSVALEQNSLERKPS
ncbi:CBS domain-containing protein [Oxynema aestuarii AP17]|uniref:histidine kinase n=1 Tax=Oxynema aestuarii AP17 TaxID=2064643 RepID=A0A6H1TVZ7_9CYAN|nr:CBS domain-containing protein [Oxynema aestuarii AP17]